MTKTTIESLRELSAAVDELLSDHESLTGYKCECDPGDKDAPERICSQCKVRNALAALSQGEVSEDVVLWALGTRVPEEVRSRYGYPAHYTVSDYMAGDTNENRLMMRTLLEAVSKQFPSLSANHPEAQQPEAVACPHDEWTHSANGKGYVCSTCDEYMKDNDPLADTTPPKPAEAGQMWPIESVREVARVIDQCQRLGQDSETTASQVLLAMKETHPTTPTHDGGGDDSFLVTYSVNFMDGWLEDEGEEVKRNWERVRAAALTPATPQGGK